VERIKMYILYSVTFSQKSSQTGHRWQYNMAHVLSILDNCGYRHALVMCNTYCFSMAREVLQMRLSIVLHVHSLSCSVLPLHLLLLPQKYLHLVVVELDVSYFCWVFGYCLIFSLPLIVLQSVLSMYWWPSLHLLLFALLAFACI
jgi:hypothetical protein